MTESAQDQCARVHAQWHEYAVARDTDKLLALYAEDAVLESPLVSAILDVESGALKGHAQIYRFFSEGVKRRPNHLVRWFRTEKFLTDGATLMWEYPRETPAGEQVDILEVMEIKDGKIAAHRIYWGWFGAGLLTRNAVGKALKVTAS